MDGEGKVEATIYLAGPMRGYEMYNFPAFFAAAMELRSYGWIVYNPAERDMAHGFNPTLGLPEQPSFKMSDAFKWDFEMIAQAVAVAFLPGWKESEGCKAEFLLAKLMGKLIYFLDVETGYDGEIEYWPRCMPTDEYSIKTEVVKNGESARTE